MCATLAHGGPVDVLILVGRPTRSQPGTGVAYQGGAWAVSPCGGESMRRSARRLIGIKGRLSQSWCALAYPTAASGP